MDRLILAADPFGGVSIPGYAPDVGKFNDRPVEVSTTTAGVLLAHDGTEIPLPDFDKMLTAL